MSYCQEANISDCEPMFNSKSLSFEVGDLEDLDPNLSYLIDEQYKVNFDTRYVIDGKRSLRIDGLKENLKTFATISLKIPFKVKKDAIIKVSVWAKTDSLRGENSGAILRLMGYNDTKGANPSIFEFSETNLKGSEAWTLLSLTTSVKEDVNSIVVSTLMQGKGSAWFDDLKLQINNEKITDILFFEDAEVEEKTKKLVRAYVTPLDLQSLPKIGDFISNHHPNARIIGLGEATHGTKEIYQFKTEIIKALIETHQVEKLALEAYYANTEELNNYINKGHGDLNTLISNLGFFLYRTKEFKDLIRWLKDYNNSTTSKISITGVDSQPGGNSLKVLSEKLKNDTYSSKLLNQLNSDTLKISQKIAILDQLFTRTKEIKSDELIITNARILKDSYYLSQFSGLKYSRVRDSLMAQNIEYLETNLAPEKKIIYWAHDLHIQKKEGWTGGYLNEKFGNNYMNLGFLLGSGTFTAVDKDSRKLDSDNKLSAIKCNSLEAIMHSYNDSTLLFKNKAASNDLFLKNNFFSKYLEKRSIGALDGRDQFIALGEDAGNIFDLLIYFKNSTATEILK